jgi:uncharacterized protein (UPF0212 family)
VPNDEYSGFVGWILDDVFLLGNSNSEAIALTVRYLFFNMLGRQHALKVANGVIAKSIHAIADDQGVRLGLDPT